jgi:SAM-dependent methyltransferase
VGTTNAVNVASSNEEQLRAWDGDEGAYWAEHADHFDRSIAVYHERLLSVAAIRSADRVLDIGCGTGQTSRDAGRAAPQGSAVGVDLSSRMLECARRRTAEAGLTNVTYEQADAQVHPFPRHGYDVAISRTGAMFFGDHVAAFTNVANALTPQGRLALVVWQAPAANEWIREIFSALAAGRDLPGPQPDAPGPFSLSDPARVHDLLATAGFTDITVDGLEAPMRFGDDGDDAHRFVLGLMGWMLDGLDDAGRARAVEDLRATMHAHDTGEGVTFGSAVWTVTAVRA